MANIQLMRNCFVELEELASNIPGAQFHQSTKTNYYTHAPVASTSTANVEEPQTSVNQRGGFFQSLKTKYNLDDSSSVISIASSTCTLYSNDSQEGIICLPSPSKKPAVDARPQPQPTRSGDSRRKSSSSTETLDASVPITSSNKLLPSSANKSALLYPTSRSFLSSESSSEDDIEPMPRDFGTQTEGQCNANDLNQMKEELQRVVASNRMLEQENAELRLKLAASEAANRNR